MTTFEEISINRKKWAKALREGGYKQARNHLGDEEDGFCCLGVAQVLFDVENYGYDKSVSPRSTVPTTTVQIKLGLGYDSMNDLINMNDTQRKSFGQIADFIESPSLYVLIDGKIQTAEGQAVG